ncbi:Enoyl-CoA-hydratase, peroxisomal [Mycena sanguinolenta]|uniref:Enoyl-CoA-hydratase, peroxisomal n=1 Tax=Mycena sanguinolenta TaxID=230812 RepID=A0A8H6Z912_9AGAR|nr:Enoyl-CoA-hydratase, peroxisomal [Mycena sanguinolenta]
MSTPNYSALGFTHILVSLDGPVLVVLMNRSKQRNTWDGTVANELQEIFALADKDDRVRVVILTAAHTAPAYCAGAEISGGWDILWDAESKKEGPHAHRDSGGQTSLVIYRCRKITIAAVNGHAAGVGMTAMQLPFDFRFVWAGAKLTFPFVRRGIVPEATSSYLLPRLVGQSRANSILLTGATFTPDSPFMQGLYHQILPTREEVLPAALAFAKELAATTSQVSIAVTKGLIQNSGNSVEENHLLDSRGIRELAMNDGEEGIRSFLEKREPKFTGTLSKDLGSWFPWWQQADTKHRKSKL